MTEATREQPAGGALPLEEALPETFTVDGKEVSRENFLKQVENYDDLQGEYTRTTQELEGLKGRVDELSRQQQTPPAPAPAPGEPTPDPGPERPDFAAQRRELDGYSLEPEEHQARLEKIIETERDWDRTAMRSEFTQEMDRRDAANKRRTDGQVQAGARGQDQDRANARTMDAVISARGLDLSTQERDALETARTGLWSQEHCTYDDATGKFVYNEAATEAALWLVPSIRDRLVGEETSKVREEATRAARAGDQARDSAPTRSASGEPLESQSVEELTGSLQTMSRAEALRFADANPTKSEEVMQHMRTLAEAEAEAAGV